MVAVIPRIGDCAAASRAIEKIPKGDNQRKSDSAPRRPRLDGDDREARACASISETIILHQR